MSRQRCRTTTVVIVLLLAVVGLVRAEPSAAANRTDSTIVPSPNTSAVLDNVLESVDCVSDSFCMAVGHANDGISDRTLVLRWDGDSWSILPSPNASPSQQSLKSVTCESTSFCIAVGFSFGGSGLEALVLLWDGTDWSIVPGLSTAPGTTTSLHSVSCVSTSSCVAVGNIWSGPVSQTLVARWDGAVWTQVSSPNTAPTLNNSLFSVSCVTESFCMAAGNHSDGASSMTLVLEWNGTTWTKVASPSPWRYDSPTQNDGLTSVVCTSTTSCVAVGAFGFNSARTTLVLGWNGVEWTQVDSPDPSIYRSPLSSVSCANESSCAAVGNSRFPEDPLDHALVIWSGSTWIEADTPVDGASVLSGVSCLSPSSCIGVGHAMTGSVKRTLIMTLTRPEERAVPAFTG